MRIKTGCPLPTVGIKIFASLSTLFHHRGTATIDSQDYKDMRNPRYLHIAYISFFFVQSFDCLLFITLSRHLFKDRSILTGPTQFWIQANAVVLFPLALLVFLLRHEHITSSVGRRVAWAFTLFHALSLGLVAWHWIFGLWILDHTWAVVGFHGTWFASGAAALAGF